MDAEIVNLYMFGTEYQRLYLRAHRLEEASLSLAKAEEAMAVPGGPGHRLGDLGQAAEAVAVCATKSLLTHSIVSPTLAETCAGENLSLSMVTRIVSAARAGAAHDMALNKLSAKSLGPIGTSYFSDWATCSACCS
jgi:hypothetical protein